MCLAIYKPAETKPDWTAYENGHDSNPHSWGFAALHDGHLLVVHGLGDYSEFRAAFEPYSDCQALIHFRWATHGNTDLLNCHPFMVSGDLAMIHNGIVSIERNVNQAMSDTWHFNELVLKPMHSRDPDFFLHQDMTYTQEMAHTGSKFCFLRADGKHGIWNAKSGTWASDGHWYSNDGYKASRYTSIGSYSWRDMGPSTSRLTYNSSKEQALDIARDNDDLLLCERQSTLLRDPMGYDEDEIETLEDESQFYTDMRFDDLCAFGFRKETLDDVFEMYGHAGIEALHDLM